MRAAIVALVICVASAEAHAQGAYVPISGGGPTPSYVTVESDFIRVPLRSGAPGTFSVAGYGVLGFSLAAAPLWNVDELAFDRLSPTKAYGLFDDHAPIWPDVRTDWIGWWGVWGTLDDGFLGVGPAHLRTLFAKEPFIAVAGVALPFGVALWGSSPKSGLGFDGFVRAGLATETYASIDVGVHARANPQDGLTVVGEVTARLALFRLSVGAGQRPDGPVVTIALGADQIR